jgi:hypothetical protein
VDIYVLGCEAGGGTEDLGEAGDEFVEFVVGFRGEFEVIFELRETLLLRVSC